MGALSISDTINTFYPEIGRAGVAIYNKSNPKGAFIVLAPSGYGLFRYKRANGAYEECFIFIWSFPNHRYDKYV